MARLKIARSFNCGLGSKIISSPNGAAENYDGQSGRPCRDLMSFCPRIPQLKLRANFGRRSAAENSRPKSRSTKWPAGIISLFDALADWAANDIFENNLYKTGSFGVLSGMSKKSVMLITLALMGTLVLCYGSYLAAHPPKTKKRPIHIHTVNSITGFSITVTNNTTLKPLPVSKP